MKSILKIVLIFLVALQANAQSSKYKCMLQMTNYMGHFTRVINIHHNYDLNNNWLYALLHECGHTLQPANNVGINAYKNIDSDEHPKKFVLGRLMNEIDEWDNGLQISKEFGLKIDISAWEREKENDFFSYK